MQKAIFILSMALLILAGSLQAQTAEEKTRILFLLDGSASMAGIWDQTIKISIAKSVLKDMADSIDNIPNVEYALRAYGHQSPKGLQDCEDSKLIVPFAANNYNAISTALGAVKTKGVTPMAYSIKEGANDFPKDPSRNFIVILTDGAESCGGDPCAMAKALRDNNVVLKLFVVGFGLDTKLQDEYRCLGTYFDATNAEMFKSIMKKIVSAVLNSSSTSIHLLDANQQPTETDVNMTLTDAKTGKVKFNLYHSINQFGKPDSLSLDPETVYNVKVHTIPPVYKTDVTVEKGVSKIITIDAPQGNLYLKQPVAALYKNISSQLKCLVRKAGEDEIINVQEFNATEKYITGKYDLEILTLPRTYVEKVDISQSKTTTIDVTSPGIVTVLKNFSMIGAIFWNDNGTLKKLYDIHPTNKKETIALQPGDYKVIYRSKTAKQAAKSKEKIFKVESNKSHTVQL